MPKTFDELEAKAEATIAAKLGVYQKAAPAIGVVFAVMMIVYGVLLMSGGALAGSLLAVATAVVLLWFVSLIRTARAALSAVTP